MKIGYARCSTKEQDLTLQTEALEKYGCEIIFKDLGQSGKKGSRPELDKCLAHLKEGDVLVVWKLDRLFRSIVHFSRAWQDFKKRKIELVSITQGFDTASSAGRLMMNILMSFAEFESEMIGERVAAGKKVAIAAGSKQGPKFKYGAAPDKGKCSKSTWYRRKVKIGEMI